MPLAFIQEDFLVNVCVCVTIYTMLKLTLTLTQTHTQKLRVNRVDVLTIVNPVFIFVTVTLFSPSK